MAKAKSTTKDTKGTSKKSQAAPKAEAPADGWFQSGNAGFQRKHQMDAAAALKKERAVPRFFLKAKEEAVLIFVDDTGIFINEHNLKIDGRWGNFVTCTKEFKPCPVCDGDRRSTYTGYFTVIDTREFEIKSGPNQGKKIKNRKILYPAKGAALAILEELKGKYGSLVGRAFKVRRTSDTDPNCGRDFDHIGKMNVSDLKKLPADAMKPFDYKKILSPLTDKELADMGFGDEGLMGAAEEPVGGSDSSGGKGVSLKDLI